MQEIAGIIIIFLGAFLNITAIEKCYSLIIGIACTVGVVAIWFTSLYEFEKLEMLMNLKEELAEKEN